MSRSLNNLRRALLEPLGSHLEDDKLAEIAAAEAAGEDVDALYAAAMDHLSQCPDCTAAYGELATIWQAAVSGMSAAAQTVTPQQAFLALLQKDSTTLINEATLETAALPLLFSQPPETPEAFDTVLANAAIPPQSGNVVQVAKRNLAALAAFLAGAAAEAWGKAVEVKTDVSVQYCHLQLTPAASPAMPVLSSGETGSDWLLLSRRVGRSVTWHISARAQRESATSCTLRVQADRPGLVDAAGRRITIMYGLETKMAVTDANGVAAFPHIPIAALTRLRMTIDTQEGAG